MPVEPYQVALYAHYTGLMIFAVGLIITFRAAAPKLLQRGAYGVAGAGFLLAWGGGHLSAQWSGGDLFTVVNVVGFIVLAAAMNAVHWRAANAGEPQAPKRGQRGLTLRRFGWIEGASLVLLMAVAMPLKYLAQIDEMVRYVGMVHGVLFLVFVAWVLWAARQGQWTLEKTLGALVASVIPFGPFVADLAE